MTTIMSSSADRLEGQGLLREPDEETTGGCCQTGGWGRAFAIAGTALLAAADVITPIFFLATNPQNETLFKVGLGWTAGNVIAVACICVALEDFPGKSSLVAGRNYYHHGVR